MAMTFIGQSVVVQIAVVGRGSLGIATEEDLAVSPAVDLAVDDTAELAVVSGMAWLGTSAVETVAFVGKGAGVPPLSEV